VALNTAAIPSELLESELFGHEAGAFTGAVRRVAGRFEQAEGGTLFLDEIGDMPLALQTRLLRCWPREFYRVGGRELIRGNVRIVAATHQDLATRVAAGQFRADLMHRLDVVRIELPSLRTRRSDIPLLAQHFLAAAAQQLKLAPKRFSRAALKLVAQRDYPGNVRELENLCRRLAVVAAGRRSCPAISASAHRWPVAASGPMRCATGPWRRWPTARPTSMRVPARRSIRPCWRRRCWRTKATGRMRRRRWVWGATRSPASWAHRARGGADAMADGMARGHSRRRRTPAFRHGGDLRHIRRGATTGIKPV